VLLIGLELQRLLLSVGIGDRVVALPAEARDNPGKRFRGLAVLAIPRQFAGADELLGLSDRLDGAAQQRLGPLPLGSRALDDDDLRRADGDVAAGLNVRDARLLLSAHGPRSSRIRPGSD
jgi:hypothetical protein